MVRNILGVSSLAVFGLLSSAVSLAGTSVAQQEYAKFKAHDHAEIDLDNGKRLSYDVVSRSLNGNVEIISAKLNDPLQSELKGYNNFIVTLDNDKKELQGFVHTSDGKFQLDTSSPYPVWKKITKPHVIDSVLKSPKNITKAKMQKLTLAAAAEVGSTEKDANGNYVIDVYMGFSDQAAAFINGNILARAQQEIATVNTSLKNSNIQGVYLRLVGVGTTPNNPGVIWEPEELSPLIHVYDWFAADIARLQPDLIAIQQVQTGAPGSAGGWAPVPGETQVVDINMPGAWVHEVGHSMGGLHCKNDEPDNTGYNYGYSVRDGYGTVMCGNEMFYFSSPLIRDDQGNVLGDAQDADMARVWRERMAEVAATRIHTVPFDSSTSSSKSSIASSKSSLSSSSALSSSKSSVPSSKSSLSSVAPSSSSKSSVPSSKSSAPSSKSSSSFLSSAKSSTASSKSSLSSKSLSSSSKSSLSSKSLSSSSKSSLSSKSLSSSSKSSASSSKSSLSSSSKSSSSVPSFINSPVVIQNYWMDEQSINIEGGNLASSNVLPSLYSDQWIFERVNSSNYFRIKNRLSPTRYLNIETGSLQASVIGGGWWSAMWTIEPVQGEADSTLFRLKNRWMPDQYINIEQGVLVASPIQSGWWSAMWRLNPAN